MMDDLKQSGLWKETLIIWGGEFGRTPTSEGVGKPGRDHNPHGFSMGLAGAGVKGGQSIGATDELGFKAVEEPCHISDLHATILHLMGLGHKRLTYFYQGLDQRLTGFRGKVVKFLPRRALESRLQAPRAGLGAPFLCNCCAIHTPHLLHRNALVAQKRSSRRCGVSKPLFGKRLSRSIAVWEEVS
jgi:hypothetical protein